MKQVIKQEEAVIAVDYSDLMSFVADNCDIHDQDDAWEYAENLVINGILCGEKVKLFYVDHLKQSNLYEEHGFTDEKEWLLKFFDSHPFIKKMVIYYND